MKIIIDLPDDAVQIIEDIAKKEMRSRKAQIEKIVMDNINQYQDEAK